MLVDAFTHFGVESAQLHENNQTGHAQENVGPNLARKTHPICMYPIIKTPFISYHHVKMMNKVDAKYRHFAHQIGVI